MATNPAMLDKLGLILAFAMGAVVLFLGSVEFFAIFIVFLVASVVATKYGHLQKRDVGLYEHERSWENVLANGIVPMAAAVAFPFIGWGAYIGSVAAIASDKFASEFGVLDRADPISLLTLKAGKRGESGCVSPLGTLMSFNGALVIGIAALFLMPSQVDGWKMILIASVGFVGSFADSLAGVLEEKGIGTKATTNAICAVVGAVLGWAVLR
ncbi:hypothetical protein COU37_02560 [Candidatus Micrarchaeota archaeon CG10_big_fil_rev_8_21_14_0_10_45_29]|nr:MAG: hypothetical protein COU37_02560 [Candidatus Micrarchaeota archaeon CG10_big_fil_rev_8_21_14_0_10_45_29]